MSEGSLPVFEHEFWMRRCLALAERGWGKVSPNPMVGSVLVRDGVVVAEGWHAFFGGAHAERMLFEGLESGGGLESGAEMNIESGIDGDSRMVRNGGQNEDFSDCILYVSLEPCAHYGKTPPCANLILEKGVGRVVVGVLDPNPKVSGRGVEILRAAGVKVLVGVLADECRRLNGSFWVNQVLGRTAVVAKWAETGDGFMGRVSDERVLISGEESGRWVHHLRSGMDAILVGVNTWNMDQPKLNVRGLEVSKQPIRIVLDCRLRGEYSAEAVNRSEAPLWVIYDLNFLESDEAMGIRELQFQSLSEASGSDKLVGWGLDFAEVALEQKNLDNWIEKLLQWFYEAHGLGVILVEGGASILQSFLDADCVDEIHILRNSQMRLESGVMSPNLDRGMLHRDADFGSDEHWVWQRKVGGVSIETGEGDRAE